MSPHSSATAEPIGHGNVTWNSEPAAKAKSAADFLDEAAQTFRDRNAVYGDNFKRVGAVMAALFPDGITLKTEDDHNRFHIFALCVIKLTRYTQNWSKGGHADSIHDNTVYSAMLEAIDAEITGRGK